MASKMALLCIVILLAGSGVVQSTEMTFELPDRVKQCFYEMIEEGTEAFLDFQVSYHTSCMLTYNYINFVYYTINSMPQLIAYIHDLKN